METAATEGGAADGTEVRPYEGLVAGGHDVSGPYMGCGGLRWVRVFWAYSPSSSMTWSTLGWQGMCSCRR